MPEMGLRILYVGDDKQVGEHVNERDRAKYLREQYWVDFAPWPGLSSGRSLGLYRLQRQEFGIKPDSPGDRFYFYADGEKASTGLLWTEVTEVYESNDVAAQVNAFIRSRLGLRMSHRSRTIDIDGFEAAIDKSLPSTDREKDMTNRVTNRIKKKAKQCRDVFETYGKGRLVVGLPLWFAMPPTDLVPKQDLCLSHKGFFCDMRRWLSEVGGAMLRDPMCTFSLVQLVWEPSWQAVSQWVKKAGPLGPLDEKALFEDRDFMWIPMTIQVGEESFTPPGQVLGRMTGRAAKVAALFHEKLKME